MSIFTQINPPVGIPEKNNSSVESSEIMHETKRKIFKCAAALFSERGFDAVSMRDVAAEVGINVGAIYNHYSAKKKMLEDMYDFYLKNVRTKISDRHLMLEMAETMPPQEVLSQVITHYDTAQAECMSQIIRIALSRAQTDEMAQRLVRIIYYEHIEQVLRPLLNRLIELEKIQPVNVDVIIEIYRSMCLNASQRMGTWSEIGTDQWREMVNTLFTLVSYSDSDAIHGVKH